MADIQQPTSSIPELNLLLGQLRLPFAVRPKQLECIESLDKWVVGGLHSEVGTGKTVMATLTALVRRPRKVIVTMPPILLSQWEQWLNSLGLAEAGLPSKVLVFQGPKRDPEDLFTHDWILCSHAIFRDSFDEIRKAFKSSHDYLIVDEAQALKNTDSKLYRYTKTLLGVDGQALMVTGTPTSKPDDCYSYIKLKSPQTYRSWGHFNSMHVADVDYFGKTTKWKNLDVLADNFAYATVKLTREDIFGPQEPARIYPLKYRLSPEHQKLYIKLAEEQLVLLGDTKIDATTPSKLYHALQQIVVNLDHFSGKPDKRSAAYDVIDQYIEDCDCLNPASGKAIIWTYYQKTSDSIVAYLRKKYGDRTVAAAYGKVDSAKGVQAAMHDPECRIFVAVPRSCGAGLNLQHVANTMLFIETPIIPMEAIQAIGRIDRTGQTKVCDIRVATALNTIQTRLFRQLLAKDDLVSQVEMNTKTLRAALLGAE